MTRKVCETEALLEAGKLELNQSFSIRCEAWNPRRLAYKIKGRWRNMGLMVVVYEKDREVYVERPSFTDPKKRLSRDRVLFSSLLGVLVDLGLADREER